MSESKSPDAGPIGGLHFVNPDDPNMAQMQAALQAALCAPIPRFYVNGVGMAMTATDLLITIIWNGTPVCNMNMTLSMAKGLSEDLARAVRDYERISEQTVQTVGQIAAAMQRSRGSTPAEDD